MGTQSSWQGEQSTSHNNGLVDQAKGAVSEVAEAAKEQVSSKIGNQKGRLAGQIGGVAKALRDTSSQLEEKDEAAFVSGYVQQAATQVERLADYLESRDVSDLVHEVQSVARREPAIFLGGLFTLGLIAGRFLKSSSSNIETPDAGRRALPQGSYQPNYQQGRQAGGYDRWSSDASATGAGSGRSETGLSGARAEAGAVGGQRPAVGAGLGSGGVGGAGSTTPGAGASSGTSGASNAAFPLSGTAAVPKPRPDVIPPAPIREVGTSTGTSGAAGASPASSGSSVSGTTSTTTTPGTGPSPSPPGSGSSSSSREPRGGSGAS